MFEKLQQKWKVNGLQLLLILFTFAIGGSACGYAGRKLLELLNIDNRIIWIILYILIVTILWPICVLLVSIVFGQFNFFKKYLLKIFQRISGRKNTNTNKSTINIAIFASGKGSNAEKIIAVAQQQGIQKKKFKVALIVCNKPGAGVLQIAKDNHIPTLLIEKERFFKGDGYAGELKKHNIGFIVLAGFLWKIPSVLIKNYPDKIINIHPALLPKYGGKGMYGDRVHEAVIKDKEKESGITIHYVDEHYDNGDIIFQAKCRVDENDTLETLAKKIHLMEHEYYPTIIQQVINEFSN